MQIFNVLDADGRSDPRVATDPVVPIAHCTRQEAIETEPNLRLCSLPRTEENCGPITRMVLEMLYRVEGVDLRFVLVDVRTHHMQKGDTPSVNTPWHVDSERSFHNQSQHVNTVHYVFLSGPPFTEFIVDRNIAFNLQKLQQLPKFYAPAGKIIRYNSTELHRARRWTEAASQWRYFFRATTYPEAPRRRDLFENRVYAGPTPCSRPR